MFKPKSQKDQQQQPFYLSWFAGQGENLKRGGTAPHQSRKEKLQFKSPYQQPLTTIVHNVPNPYSKAISQPRTYQNNIQQISKIYAGSMLKRKSLEKTDIRGSHKQPRTFTQQHQRNQNFSEGRPQTQQMNTLDPKHLYKEEPLPQQDNDDFEIMEIDNNDNFSNQSSEADSDEHQNLQLPTQQPEEVEMHKNKSFVQKQQEEPIVSMRKATATLNRPQTSEGGRRKRFVNSADSEQQPQPAEIEPRIIEEDEFENLEIIPIVSPVEIGSMRSGFRRKQTDQVDDPNERPPSRHKTPPKATDLELPLQNAEINRDGMEIPIKNMYAQIEDKTDDFDDFDLNFFKNKVNLKKFQQKEVGYHTDDGKKQHSGQKHPHSANLKQNLLGFQNMSYSPLNTQITSAHGFRNEGQIVIKYNTSSALHKQSNQPVKVPFQTSLGQDFLRLFANDCIE